MNAFVAENPFSTRRTRPGAIAFRFHGNESAEAIIERLRERQWWGQIVGPHGSGKSTLLATLLPTLEAAGREVRIVTLHQGDRRVPFSKADWRRLSSSAQVVVDGYEQLSWFARLSLARRCRRYGCGLLVTAHRDLGVPTIFATRPELQLAKQVVLELAGATDAVADRDVESAWQTRDGNLREVLFDLYDLFEERRL